MKFQRIEPKAGQESVWDYPRPPRLEPTTKHLKIIFGGATIAETTRAFRVLETSHPPVYYFPPDNVEMEFLREVAGSSFCEWKGRAGYYSIVTTAKRAEKAAWFYPNPTPAFSQIKKLYCVLSVKNGRVLRQRRTRRVPRRRFLRRLDHQRNCRTV